MLTTLVVSTVEPGLVTKSTTSWKFFACLVALWTEPEYFHAPDTWVQMPAWTSDRALSAGLKGTVPPGSITDVRGEDALGVPVVGWAEDPEEEQLARSAEQPTIKVTARTVAVHRW